MAIDKPDLTRVWAAGAPSGNVVDPDTTVPGKFNAGWLAEVPPFEHFNFLQKYFSEANAYNNEQGINEWDDVTTYPVKAIVKGSDGNLYSAVLEQSNNDPVGDDGTNWLLILDLNLPINNEFSNISSLISADVSEGQTVKTNSYHTPVAPLANKGGAEYLIMSLVDFGSTPDEYGDHTLDNGLVAKLIKKENIAEIEQFGALVGASAAVNTACIQAAIDSGNHTRVPANSTYSVSELALNERHTLEGYNRFNSVLIGDGSGPVISCGTGSLGANRGHSLYRLRIENTNDCVFVNAAPNFTMRDCSVNSTGFNGLKVTFSFRVDLINNFINSSGSGSIALNAYDNVNGLTVINNTISGGSQGKAIRVEQSQAINFTTNIIESSLDGIWISSDSGTGSGNCNGVILHGNYIEQCSTPFVLAAESSIIGLSMEGNYVGNSETSVVSARTSVVKHGRLYSSTIKNNSFIVLGGIENVLDINLDHITCDIEGVTWENNYVQNTPASYLVKSGTYAANATVLDILGRDNFYDFNELYGASTKTKGMKEYISPTLYSNESIENEWISIDSDYEFNFGGYIHSVEIIDAQGSVNCTVSLGNRSTTTTNVASVNISTLTYTRGRAFMTLANATLDNTPTTGYNRYTVTAGATSDPFRIRILYRAN